MKVAESLYTTQDFAESAGEALEAAQVAPVTIADETDHGRLYVLMSMDHYMALKSRSISIADLLSTPGAESIDLESFLPKREEAARPVSLD